MTINLSTGRLDSNSNVDGWVITSAHAVVEGREDIQLVKGDRITLNGDIYRGDEYMGNIA